MFSVIAIIALSYLLGSIPTSLWLGRLYYGIDIREHGSKNPGATNTFRILGWKVGSVVALIDMAKGFVAAFYISQIGYHLGDVAVTFWGWDTDIFMRLIAGSVAMVGHMYPVFAGFTGGKGVITGAGMLFGIEPISISLTLLVFLVILFTSRYVSVASMSSAAFYPLSLLVMRYQLDIEVDGSLIVITTLLALGIIIKHHSNIRRLWQGTEHRLSSFTPSKGRINEEKPS